MKVFLVRHGESETNKAHLWTGWMDVPLTEKGRADATLAGRVLAGVDFDRVYASDLIRAQATAQIALPGCAYETTPLLREVNVGSIAGKPFEAVLDSEGKPRNADGYAVFGGESTAELRERIASFMRMLEKEQAENIAVFAHAGVLRTFLGLVLGEAVPIKKLLCKNCTVAVFEYRNGTWMLHSWINPD